MSLKLNFFVLLGAILWAIPQASAANIVARCNYDFDIRPGVYDRGSLSIIKSATGYRMQFIQDDEPTVYDKVTVSTASGDWARDTIKKDATFSKYVYDGHIDPTQIDHVDGYAAPKAADGDEPQARFFVFLGLGNRFLGGFGLFGKTPFLCDWAE